jgi:Bacterial extracellular solute-binding protein
MADEPKLTCLGKTFIFLFILACVGGAYLVFTHKTPWSSPGKNPSSPGILDSFGGGNQVEVGIAYGTEKERWLEWAVQQFAQTRDGKRIKINLIPMGSLEGAHALLNGDQRIQVWSPASALYKDIFVQEWQVKYNQNPILKEEPLALSPMVFVMWEERYQAFIQKYKTVSFATIGQALQEKGGWDTIAQKPEWGLFKFGHTHPNESNSGLMTIVLAAYSYQKKTKDLDLKDVVDVGFQNWLQTFERGVSGLSNSTGNMMKEMVLKGPSSYDALFVYESVAIDYLKNAEGRWGRLRVVYPEYNAWNDNPYYIIDATWSSNDQRKAAQTFLDFLLSDPIQKESLTHGFRPANPDVPIKFPDSPFVKYADYGIKVDLAKICEPPRAEVVNNLLESWQRSQGNR